MTIAGALLQLTRSGTHTKVLESLNTAISSTACCNGPDVHIVSLSFELQQHVQSQQENQHQPCKLFIQRLSEDAGDLTSVDIQLYQWSDRAAPDEHYDLVKVGSTCSCIMSMHVGQRRNVNMIVSSSLYRQNAVRRWQTSNNMQPAPHTRVKLRYLWQPV